jgi:translocation and assembly module TamA
MKTRTFSILCFCVLLLVPLAARAAKGVDVDITGIGDPLKKNVQLMLGLINESPKKQPSAAEVRRLYTQAPSEIKAALQPFGYYSPVIRSDLKQSGDTFKATFHVDAGPPTTVRNLEVRVQGPGKKNKSIQQALKGSKLANGKRLIQPDYDHLKDALQSAAQSAGFLDADYVKHRIAVHPEKQSASIQLVLDTGPRYYFGPITVKQDILAPSFIRKFDPIRPGDVFTTDRLLRLQLALRDSQYFSRVTSEVEKKKAVHHHIPVVLTAKASPSAHYMGSIGYGTDTGPRIGAGVLFRHINRHGHQFKANARLSAIKSQLSTQYKIPVGDVRTDYFAANGIVGNTHINDAHSFRQDLGVELNQSWLGGRRRLSLDYDHEHFYFGKEPARTTGLLIPGISYTRKIADNPLFPRRGYRLSLDAHGSAKALVSDTSFLSLDANIRAAFPLGKETRLLLYGEVGAIDASEFDRLPPDERFFTGGARTVRGYGYYELAPRDAAGNIVGGRYLDNASIEIDHLFIGNFGAAAFVDAGNVSNSFAPKPRTDAGIGLRYRTPVGMVRLDVAHTLNDPRHNHWHLQISIGPYF